MNRDRVSKRRVVVQVALGFFSAIGVVVACDSDGMPIAGDAGATGPSAHDAASDDGGIHRDSQVAYALVAANAAVLEQSATAEAKAKDPLVKDFARLLMRDHGAATERTRAVAKQKELGLADSAISQKFTEDAEELATRFAQRDDASFDKAY
ncbi:MAG TPA: DUF4142 domain-containing protein, partial [Labilithrix sp.]|nr:DUF4142 domain-containing protein [Labilithrix sp.]